MCVLFYSSFVCVSAYANVYFKTTIRKQIIRIILIAGVPSSQALPGFLITAPPSVCVPDVIGVLAVWISKPKKNNPALRTSEERLLSGASKEKFGRMISEKNLLWGTVLNFCQQRKNGGRCSWRRRNV